MIGLGLYLGLCGGGVGGGSQSCVYVCKRRRCVCVCKKCPCLESNQIIESDRMDTVVLT